MKKNKLISVLCFLLLFGTSVNAQLFSFSGQIGYANPQGDIFKDDVTGDKLSSFGIGYDADVMMCFDRFNNKLSAGITYVGNALFGSESSTGFDIGMYGLSLYGVKGHYRLLVPEKKVSPYVALGLGLSQFSTPDVYYGDDLIAEGKSAFSLGIRPEIGFDLGGFLISAAYMVPMKYNVKSETGDFKGSAGALSISIGWRQYISLGGSGFSRKKDQSASETSASIETQASKEKTEKTAKEKTEKEKVSKESSNKEQATKKSKEDTKQVSSSSATTQTVVSVEERRRRAEEIERQDAEAKAKEPKDEIPVTKFPEIQVGQTAMYRDKGQWHAGKIIELIIAGSGEKAVIQISDGSTIERYLEDIQVIK